MMFFDKLFGSIKTKNESKSLPLKIQEKKENKTEEPLKYLINNTPQKDKNKNEFTKRNNSLAHQSIFLKNHNSKNLTLDQKRDS